MSGYYRNREAAIVFFFKVRLILHYIHSMGAIAFLGEKHVHDELRCWTKTFTIWGTTAVSENPLHAYIAERKKERERERGGGMF